MKTRKEQIPTEMRINPGEEKFYKKLGAHLSQAREHQKITLETMASILDIDIEQMQKYENGELAIPIYHLYTVAKFMNFPAELEHITEQN